MTLVVTDILLESKEVKTFQAHLVHFLLQIFNQSVLQGTLVHIGGKYLGTIMFVLGVFISLGWSLILACSTLELGNTYICIF